MATRPNWVAADIGPALFLDGAERPNRLGRRIPCLAHTGELLGVDSGTVSRAATTTNASRCLDPVNADLLLPKPRQLGRSSRLPGPIRSNNIEYRAGRGLVGTQERVQRVGSSAKRSVLFQLLHDVRWPAVILHL